MAAKQSDEAQLTLIHTSDNPATDDGPRKRGRRRTGRHERALDRLVKAEPELQRPVMAASVSLLRSLACGMDAAERKGELYATSQLGAQYRETLQRMGLLGDAGGGDDSAGDPLALGGPE